MFGPSTVVPIENVKVISAKYPKSPSQSYQYGTAGFRYENSILDPVMFRTGMLAVLRAKFLKKTVGVMITASHNKEEDNGVKVVDPMGEMLVSEWEVYATELANASNDQVGAVVSRIVASFKIDFSGPGSVVVGRDTRPSGPRLVRALHDGISVMEGQVKDIGEVSTPILHFVVRAINSKQDTPTEDAYNEKLVKAYKDVIVTAGASDFLPVKLVVDCANGVGAPKLAKIADLIGKDFLNVQLVNTDIRGKGVLNYNCGADYVKVDQKLPAGVSVEDSKRYRCSSLDGDADRVVFFYTDSDSGKFVLLDGDKIAALAAGFINELLTKIPSLDSVKVGVVQTAYANGASTKYFEKNKIPTACTETGVKHLHHKAEEFDVGVYFEANGHGTVLFRESLLQKLKELAGSSKEAKLILALSELINQAVGDAISDLLMVEAMLRVKRWSFKDWALNLYKDLANRQLKVKVKDRSLFVTTNADRQLVKPEGLQKDIEALVSNFESGRAFVRPSGTEDVVRVYAEASAQEKADDLAFAVASVVYDKAGGIGDKPVKK
ncbi:hypothetical protein MP638_007483 [Amoeboaphelidium occidentale]|nr:hypothetical protein MP638_007483 [Amoeboaphelidium occidentale]